MDTSDSFLLPMAQKTDSNDDKEEKKEGKKASPIVKPNRSILSRDFGSEEDDMPIFDNDEDEPKATIITAAPPKPLEVFTCISYCGDNQTLCAGTNQGNLYIWKKKSSMTTAETDNTRSLDEPENPWQLCNVAIVRGAIKHCFWGICDVLKPCVLVNCISNVYILKEQPLLSAYSQNIWITQKSATELFVEHASYSTTLRSDISAITGLCLTERNLAITNHKNITIYQIPRVDDFQKKSGTLSIKQAHSFHVNDCIQLFMHEEILIVVGLESVHLYSFGGVSLKEIIFNDNEGKWTF